MEITIGLWIIPALLTAGIFLWIIYGFDYSSGYFPSFTPLFTLPLGAALVSFVWMLYFAVLHFWGQA